MLPPSPTVNDCTGPYCKISVDCRDCPLCSEALADLDKDWGDYDLGDEVMLFGEDRR